MNQQRFNELMSKYGFEALTEPEARELLSAVQSDPALLAEFRKLHRVEMLLSSLASGGIDVEGIMRTLPERGEQPVAGQVLERAEHQELRPLPRVQKSFAQRYVRESFRANWGFRVVAAVAATLAIIAGGYWFLNNGQTQDYHPSGAALATVQTMDGKVEMTRGVQRFAVAHGMQVNDGDALVVSGEGHAEIRYAEEKTIVALSSGTTAKFWLQDNAKRVNLNAGTLVCMIAEQPAGKAMRFITPDAQAVVLGTRLKLTVINGTTELEVIEGRVELVRNDQASVVVNAGEYAVAAEGVELKSQLLEAGRAVLPSLVAKASGPMMSATNYYAQWPNGVPTDPNFFPIWVWDQNPNTAKDYKDAGINMFVVSPSSVNAAEMALLATNGMRIICPQHEYLMKDVNSKIIVGWLNYDQPDITQTDGFNWRRPAMAPSAIDQQYNTIRANDPSRPVYLIFSEGVARDDYPRRNERKNHPEDYREFAKAADILSLHVLPINEPEPPVRSNPWYIAKAIDSTHACSENAKPVWCAIECTKVSTNSPAAPTPALVKAEVWMGLVHGANGIGYLCYSRVPSFVRAALLKDKVMLAAVTEINKQITSLAPVLNSATVPDGAAVDSGNAGVPIDIMVKQYAGATYIFAVAMRDSATTATFTVPSGGKVDVLGENRGLEISGGRFSDQFESYGVHLYKVQASLQTASRR